jgi:uncharacterized membrane protein
MTLTPVIVTILIGTVLPLLVGLVTKLDASSNVKKISLITISAVQGVIVNATLIDGTALISSEMLLFAALAWVAALGSYFKVLKPTGVAPAVQNRTANIGIG